MNVGALVERIIDAKMRLLETNTFFGLLMQHLIFAVDSECPTACTDSERIYFGSDFCEKLSDDELLVVMLHELMHIVLGHCLRGAQLDSFWYNVAADIVVNSNIAKALGKEELTVCGQTLMHLAPDGKEGSLYTAEEVYDMLVTALPKGKDCGQGDKGQGTQNGQGEGAQDNAEDEQSSASDRQTPKNAPTKGAQAQSAGQTAAKPTQKGEQNGAPTLADYRDSFHDDHSSWGDVTDVFVQSKWRQRIADAASVAASMHCGDTTGLSDRFLSSLTKPVVDWRLLLNNFVQQEINDYSFVPPDRRYGGEILLPDFNVPEQKIKDLWLVMDTSGSISTKDLARAYSEVKGAIEQFGGKLGGMLSFFDAKVTDPVPFESVKDLLSIVPKGGGGTSFHAVFEYFQQRLYHKQDWTGIIIFTDGYATFPPQTYAKGVPVFWLVNNNNVTPPWGIVARYLPRGKKQ